MKVYVTSYILSIQKRGGISRFVRKLLSDFRKSNRYKKSICAEYPIPYMKNKKIISNVSKLFLLFYRILIIWILRPELIHDTYPSKLSMFLPKKKLLITIYDCMPEIFSDQYSDEIRKHRKDAISKADHIHAISESTKNDLINIFLLDDRKISVIYLNDMRKVKHAKCAPNYANRRLVLFIGNRNGYKNFSSAVKIFSHMYKKDRSLHFCIFGGGILKSEERKLILDFEISEDAFSQTFGDDTKLNKLYSKSRVLLYTSSYEGFGLPVIESINMDCPAIVSDSSSLKEVMPISRFRVKNYNNKEIDNIISNFTSEEEWLSSLTQQKEAIEKFNQYDVSEHLFKLYEKLASE